MKHLCIPEKIHIHFILRQHHVRARIPVEGEVPVSVLKGLDEGKCRMNRLILKNRLRINSAASHCFKQEAPEHILSDFSDERCLSPVILKHGKDIPGSSSGIHFKQGIALRTQSALCKVNQQFPQCHYIIFFVHCLPPYSTVIPPCLRWNPFTHVNRFPYILLHLQYANKRNSGLIFYLRLTKKNPRGSLP